MSAAMDVAYLDLPYVAHVERKAFLLRMDLHCWEEACWACTRPGCVCACHDEAFLEVPRCPECRYLFGAVGHLVTCNPGELDARVQVLADSIGRAA